jgi:hypothetical protein
MKCACQQGLPAPICSNAQAAACRAGSKKIVMEAAEGQRWASEAAALKRELAVRNEANNRAQAEVGGLAQFRHGLE